MPGGAPYHAADGPKHGAEDGDGAAGAARSHRRRRRPRFARDAPAELGIVHAVAWRSVVGHLARGDAVAAILCEARACAPERRGRVGSTDRTEPLRASMALDR